MGDCFLGSVHTSRLPYLPTGKLGRRLSVIEMRDACLGRRVKLWERSWVPYKNKELLIGELRGAASWLRGIWNPRKEWLWAHNGAGLLRVLRGPVRFGSRKWPPSPWQVENWVPRKVTSLARTQASMSVEKLLQVIFRVVLHLGREKKKWATWRTLYC